MPTSQSLDLFPSVEIFSETITNNFKFIDLFAGIGGFHLALHALGGECVFASEKDIHARTTYAANLNIEANVFNDDIRKISPDLISDHDVLCAGFPCQPFSQAGLKKGFSDGENSERGNLFYSILDILEAKRPKAFILENVRHLIAHNNGNTFSTILRHLDEANYQVSFKVIKASDFNVPQHRARVFIVGFDRNQIFTDANFHFPIPVQLTKTMSDIFNAPCEKTVGFTLRVGGKGSLIEDRRNWEFYRVNGEVKRIGLNEAREMMTFPPTFQFPVSKTQAMKQLGNSVCVDVVKAVGQSVITYLDKYTKKTKDETVQNRGEVSEMYTLLKMIHQKVLQYGDKQGLPSDRAMRVLKIKIKQKSILIHDISVEVISENGESTIISAAQLLNQKQLDDIVLGIKSESGSFHSLAVVQSIQTLGLDITKGTSYEKADVCLDFKDDLLNENQGISIKSFLGGSPTLLNASSATNFIFEISNLDAGFVDEINAISSHSKIKDRIAKVIEMGGEFSFIGCENKVYESNLKKTDSNMPEILADALLSFFKKKSTSKLSDYLPTDKIIQLSKDEVRCRLRDFVKYTILGIFPNQPWDGNISANGAILVKNEGDLIFYHTNQELILKDYFYEHCFFDTPSSTRHRFGRIYKEGKSLCFKLNLQLRLSR